MNRTLKDATVQTSHYQTHDHLQEHLQAFLRVCLRIVGRWSMTYPDETPKLTPSHQEEPHGP